MDLATIIMAAIAAKASRDHGDEAGAITIDCMMAYDGFKQELSKVYATYLKPANDRVSNEAREKALLSQRSKFKDLIEGFISELEKFVENNPIPKEILYQIEKE